jgi:threonine/homoserine/homoserine lactone efflux protein
VLFLTPGPIVTLLIATGATHGSRAALLTVIRTIAGNALLVGAIALGLIPPRLSLDLFEVG